VLRTQRINARRSKCVCVCVFPWVVYSWYLTRWTVNGTYKKWYLQSRILGVGEVFAGYRDPNDVLCYTERINVDDLATRVKGWDPQKSIDRGARVLNSLRAFCHTQMAVERDDGKVWRVVFGGQVAPNGCIGVSGASSVFLRELSVDERDIVSCREGNRIGIVPMHAVEELRSGVL